MSNKLLAPCLGLLLLAAPALAQRAPLTNQLNRPTNGIKAGAARTRVAPQKGVQVKPAFSNPSQKQVRNVQQPYQNTQQTSNGHNTWQGQNNNNYRQGQGNYYPPVYPGPNAPLPQQGTYYIPKPYGNGYYNNGGYNNGYYNNGGYNNQYQQRAPSNNGYVPYRR